MARILAIETATEACSAALLIDGEVLERYEMAPRRHAALVLPFAEALLAESGLSLGRVDAVAFGRGPGSFTGLRIAAGIVQGIAYGADLPVVPVSTLAALAQGAMPESGDGVLAALDARMQEVYWGVYWRDSAGLAQLDGEEIVCAPGQVPIPRAGDWTGAGSGWDSYAGQLAERCSIPPEQVCRHRFPRAADVARLAEQLFNGGGALPPQQAIPVYLRDNVANKPATGG